MFSVWYDVNIPEDSFTESRVKEERKNMKKKNRKHEVRLLGTGKQYIFTRLKNYIENNSTWKGAFYQSDWVEIHSMKITFPFFRFMCVPANASKMFCMAHLANICSLFILF